MHKDTFIKRGHKRGDYVSIYVSIYSVEQDYGNIDCLQTLPRFGAKNNSQNSCNIVATYRAI